MRKILRIVFALAVCCVGFSGCKTVETRYVPVESVAVHRDSVNRFLMRVDTVRERDSIAVLQRGDTVWQTRYLWRERVSLRVDTVYRALHDTIKEQIPVPVEKRPGRWEHFKSEVGGIATGIIVTIIILLAVIVLRRHIKF